MNSFYYLHLWTSSELDSETNVIDKNVNPIEINNIGLEFQDWYKDDLFRIYPVFICTDRLKSLLEYEDFSKILFTPIERIKKGCNFEDNYPEASLGKFWQIQFEGTCGKDDFALWKGLYLVVSDLALSFLREWNVTKAEADKIDGNLEDYFSSEKKNFWM